MRYLHAISVVVLTIVALAPLATSQFFSSEPQNYYDTVLSIPSSPTVDGIAISIEEATIRRDWARVAEKLQELIDDHPSTPIRTDDVFRGARMWALDFLARMPEEARKAYRERTDAEARRLFEDGLADESRLIEIVQRFRYSSYGSRAMERLADLNLERGHLLDALYYLRLMLPHLSTGDARSAAVLARAATIGGWLGDLGELQSLHTWMKRLDLGALPDPRPGDHGTVDDMLSSALTAALADPGTDDWPCMSGSPDGARPSSSVASPDRLRWYAELIPRYSANPGYVETPSGQRRGDRHRQIYATVSEGVAYMANGLEVAAHELWTGNLRWRAPSFLGTPAVSEATSSCDENEAHAVAVGDDVVVVSMEVKSNMVSKIYNNTFEIIRPIPRRILAAFDKRDGALLWTTDDRAARGDEVVKILGESSGATGLRFTSPVIVIDDLVYAVAVLYEVNFNYYAIALDAHTGELRFKTHLSAGLLEQNMFGNAVREAFPAQPAVAEGKLFVSTNHGVIAALDAKGGDILWMSRYKPENMPVNVDFATWLRAGQWAPTPLVVAGGTLIAAPTDSLRAYALDTTTGSPRWDFRRTFSSRGGRRNPEGFDQLVGVAMIADKPAVIVTGERQLMALSVETGAEVARASTPLGSDSDGVIGRPALTRDHILVPLDSGLEVRQLDSEMTLVSASAWRSLLPARPSVLAYGLPGNIVVSQGIILSSGRSHMGAFYLWDTVLESLQKALTRDGDDPMLHLQLGAVYSQAASAADDPTSDLASAAQHYKAAMENAARLPPSRADRTRHSARSGLFNVECMRAAELASAGKASAAVEVLLGSATATAPTPAEEIRAYRLAVEIYVKAGDRAGAIDVLERMNTALGTREFDAGEDIGIVRVSLATNLQIAELQSEDGRPADAAQTYQRILEHDSNDLFRGIPAREIARRSIGALIDLHGREAVYAALDSVATTEFESLSAANDVEGMKRLVERFPNALVAPRIHFHLGRLRIADPATRNLGLESLRVAVRVGSPEIGARAALLLADTYEEAGDLGRARDWLIDLRDRHGEVELESGSEITTARDLATSRLALPQFTKLGGRALKHLDLPLDAQPRASIDFESDSLPPLVLDVAGAPPTPIGEPIYLAHSEFLQTRLASTLEFAWEEPSNLTQPVFREDSAAYSGGNLVVVMQSGVAAFSISQGGASQWQRVDRDRNVLGYAIDEDVVVLVTSKRSRQEDSTVISALSSRDGSLLWESNDLDLRIGLSPDVQIAGGRVLVTEHQSSHTSTWFDLRTGALVNRFKERGISGPPLVLAAARRVVLPVRANRSPANPCQPWIYDLDSGLLLDDRVDFPSIAPFHGAASTTLAAFITQDFRRVVFLDPGAAGGRATHLESLAVDLASNEEVVQPDFKSALASDGTLITFAIVVSPPEGKQRETRLVAVDTVQRLQPYAPILLSREPGLEFDASSFKIAANSLAIATLAPSRRRSMPVGLQAPAPRVVIIDTGQGVLRQTLEVPPGGGGSRYNLAPVTRIVDGGIAVFHEFKLSTFGSSR